MRMPMRRLYRSVAPDYSLIRQKGTGVGAFGAKITGKHHVGFAERIVQCVNAMEGIPDPEGYIKELQNGMMLLGRACMAEELQEFREIPAWYRDAKAAIAKGK